MSRGTKVSDDGFQAFTWHQFASDVHYDVRSHGCFGSLDGRFSKHFIHKSTE